MIGPAELVTAISTGTFRFEEPFIILLLIPAILILILVITKSFVKIDKKRLNDPEFLKSRKRFRIFIFVTRLLIFTSLFLALAGPFGIVTEEVPGDLTLYMLIDNSSSMSLFDMKFIPTLQEQLEKRIPVKLSYISMQDTSNIGDGILGNLGKDRNMLLITDGQATKGTRLGDVLVYASSLNSSVSAIDMSQINEDVGVTISGPTKTISGVENVYRVNINKAKIDESTALDSVRLVVGVDDDILFDGTTSESSFTFKNNFTDGYHRIVARITPIGEGEEADFFKDNNVFYKTTHVIPKPKILFVTETTSALKTIFDELYEVTQVNSLPTSKDDLEQYYAVVLNDIPINRLKKIEALNEYVIEGNGLFVIGGYNSFDNGGYKGSAFESLLPVQVGAGQLRQGDINIVIVLDISGSFTENNVATTGLATSKALAYSVIQDIHEKNNVGVVAFDEWPYLVSDLEPLLVSRSTTLDKLTRLQGQGGQTDFTSGLKGAFNLLRGETGSKNIIFISDGYTWNDLIRQQSKDIASAMRDYGIKMYVIGTGRNLDENFLRNMATSGGGIYFTADTSNRLKILFGEAEKKDVGSAFSLFIIDPYHFITEALELSAVQYGYNQVVPKQSANLLITTDSGEPSVVSWRHGIGRVATLTTFSSGNNLGELLDRSNSKLLSRIVNWAIADPERKNDFYVDVPDARVNKVSEIFVRSNKFPKVKGLEFSKTDKNTYRATYINDKIGFRSILGAIYGVNYDWEFERTGVSVELDSLVSSSNGKIFTPNQVDEIVDHVKSVSRKTISQKKDFRNFFILFALVLLLGEIVTRRVRETWFLKR